MALWTPAYISTALWLDAADASTITESNGDVSQWDDKSGNGRNAVQATASKQPSHNSTTINSIGVLSFDGVSDQLDIASQPITGTVDRSIFAVVRANNYVNGGGGFLALAKTKTDEGSTWDLCLENNGFYIRVTGNVYFTPAPTGSGAHLLGNTWSGALLHAGVSAYNNGSTLSLAGGSDVSINTSASSAIVGATPLHPNVYFDGDIAEIIVISSVVNSSTRQQIEGYLAHKWGLEANLQSDHPYKLAAPAVFGIYGVITDRFGQPCQRKIYAVSRPTDATAPEILAHSLSDAATGEYELVLRSNDEVTRVVVSEDDEPLLNDIVHRVIPA
jgi:hypothetical protein